MNIRVITNEFNLFEFLGSIFVSIGLVYLIEWLKQPTVVIDLLPDLKLPDGRKLLKVNVRLFKKGWYRKLFPWENPASYARLKCEFLKMVDGKKVVVASYVAKWDTRPEPWDYSKNTLRPELMPSTSEPENLLVGDACSAAIAVKRSNEKHFYIYDANYYANPENNKRMEKEITVRINFSSSSVSFSKEFLILNGNASIDSFTLKAY